MRYMTNMEIIQKLRSGFFPGEDGEVHTIEFEPALTEKDLADLEKQFPSGKMPAEIREILKETKGWEVNGMDQTYFDAIHDFGFEELIPFSIALNHDGLGNYWVLEILADGRCGKVFYACHDPAVLVIFAETLNEYLHFVDECYNNPDESYWNEVYETAVMEVWKTNPNMHEVDAFKQNNPALIPLLSEFDETWLIADLRNAGKKDGFAWGKLGSNAHTKRLGKDLLWALKKKKKGFLSKLFG